MTLLTWRRISNGHHVSGPYAIRRSRATNHWSVYLRGAFLGYRGTLREAKGVAEMMVVRKEEAA